MRIWVLTVALTAGGLWGQTEAKQTVTELMGRRVKISQPELAEYNYTEDAASICFEGPPRPQCYTAPKHFGTVQETTVVPLPGAANALFLSVATGGVSGSVIHFALLQPSEGPNVKDLFVSDVEISSQSQHAFWNEPTVADAPVFMTADFVWDSDEAHIDSHRYLISVYTLKRRNLEGFSQYDLDDRYMTDRKYDIHESEIVDIFASERPEIIAHLERLKAERERQAKTPN